MKKIKLYVILFILSLCGCKANLYSGLASTTSDDYLIQQAKKDNDAQLYDYSIDILLYQISSGAQQRTDVKELLASAYSGKCGLNFVNYTTSLSNSLAASSPFEVVTSPFVGVAVDPSYCMKSLQTMDSIGTPLQRTANENAFTAVTGMVMMGASVRAYTDMTPTNGDGTVDINICTGLTSDQLNDVIVGFGYFATNFSYVSSSLVGSSSFSSLNQMVNVCSSVVSGTTCTTTDPAQITSATQLVIRDLINTKQYGVGPYDTGGDNTKIILSCP